MYARRRAGVAVVLLLLFWSAWWVVADRGGSTAPGATSTTGAPAIGSPFDRADVCDRSDPVEDQVLRAYGALLVATGDVVVPPRCRFTSAADAATFQAALDVRTETIAGTAVRLQSAALAELLAARAEVRAAGRDLRPRSADAAARTYQDGVSLWTDRVRSGLAHWRRAGDLTRAEADRIAALAPEAQVAEVLRLEGDGLWFGTHQTGRILQSVAPPGTSQHLSLLAFDVAEDTDATVTAAMAAHGWFRTARGDRPHFAFLGRSAAELPALGLRPELVDGVEYWVPDL